MNALVPLNVAALRVNANDAGSVVNGFTGRTAAFEKLPYQHGGNAASTGDTILRPLESGDSPLDPLGAGIHLHWELPDVFRRGVQPPDGSDIVFPHAPNRWLVIRYLRQFDATTSAYGPVTTKCWIVESDYVAPSMTADPYGIIRPAVSVPITTAPNAQPFLYMGRVLDYGAWDPGSETPSQFLSGYAGTDGKPLYLTSIGFVGPAFSSYYPECSSVFGFWDHFGDVPAIATAIAGDQPLQFDASYQVFGWLSDAASDPLAGFEQLVRSQYDAYVAQCATEQVTVAKTPADFAVSAAQQSFRWTFHESDITFTVNSDHTLNTIDLPAATLCSGIAQEIVWNMLANASTTYFLSSDPTTPTPVWQDQIELAVGNTTVEALSALLKKDLGNTGDDPNVLTNYEYLLDALQLGLLQGLESNPTIVVSLEEALHANAFSQLDGGYVWAVRQPQLDPQQQSSDQEITLPLDVAEQLALLNQAQKSYDQGRAALVQLRQQLFMDWLRYVKIYAGGATDPNVTVNQIGAFLSSSNAGELSAVTAAGNSTGILQYSTSGDSGAIGGVQTSSATASLAGQVCAAFQTVQTALAAYPSWELQAAPAPAFWMPTDPVVLLEGDRIEPVRRNGATGDLAPRLSPDVLGALSVQYAGASFSVPVSAFTTVPAIVRATPMQSDVEALAAEAFLLVPMLADTPAGALRAQGGAGNPAVANYAGFVAALQVAQGGSSPLTTAVSDGLFAAVHQTGYVPAANPVQTVTAPLAVAFTFTNAAANGWAPDPIGWNAQQAQPAFSPARVDPFLPVSLVWNAELYPMQTGTGASYTADSVTGSFALDPDGVDYVYTSSGGSFAAPNSVQYDGSVVLSKKPVYSLTAQIGAYEQTYPDDPEDATLRTISAAYQTRNLLSQGLSGFNVEQTLRSFIPQIKVQDLTMGPRDAITVAIDAAAGATAGDDWYDFGFNAQAPKPEGNFGPLRGGFAGISALEVIDVFGQRMNLTAQAVNPDGSMQTTTAMTLAPPAADTVHAAMLYLPPRLLVPTRLWFAWLSAAHNTDVAGIGADFVEMNSHPATSPVCGWILPNHLENTLFFYDAGGAPIGSFGIEHGTLTYRTRPGNAANLGDDLATDIGPENAPLVNPHVAAFMWYVDGRDAAFLVDLMATILASDAFINPANFAQNQSLAVLVGNPLALTRAVIGLETSGNVLPLSQADGKPSDPFPTAVVESAYEYATRQQFSSAGLGGVLFPLRLGDLANIDDGLVGFLIEAPGPAPYSTLYAPAAPAGGVNGVVQPAPADVELTLNAAPLAVTMLVDPRAAVHATTGIVPVASLAIPPDQYLQVLQSLAISFAVLPVLSASRGLSVPLPLESGYRWSWISAVPATAPLPQAANAVNEYAVYDYTPQTLVEGWVQLAPDPSVQQLPPAGSGNAS